MYIYTTVRSVGIGWSVCEWLGQVVGGGLNSCAVYYTRKRFVTKPTIPRRCRRRVVNRHVSVGIKKVLRVDFPGAAHRATILFKLLNPFRVLRKL